MNAPSQELMNLKEEQAAYNRGIKALEAQGLTDWAVQMVVYLKGELAKVEAKIEKMESKV